MHVRDRPNRGSELSSCARSSLAVGCWVLGAGQKKIKTRRQLECEALTGNEFVEKIHLKFDSAAHSICNRIFRGWVGDSFLYFFSGQHPAPSSQLPFPALVPEMA